MDLIDLDDVDEEAKEVEAAPARHGFLPIATNWFDRLFIAIYNDTGSQSRRWHQIKKIYNELPRPADNLNPPPWPLD